MARTMNDLGTVSLQQGNIEEAEKMYEKDVEITSKILGNDHPDVGKCETETFGRSAINLNRT